MRDILYVIEQDAACAWYRCRMPAAWLSGHGYDVEITTNPHTEARVIVFQRPSYVWSLEVLTRAVALGRTVVVEMDDDLWHIPSSNPAHMAWTRDKMDVLEECIRRATFCTVTTRALADRLRPMNRAVRILPNVLPDELWRLPEKPDRPLTIGWAGSNTHAADLALLNGVIETIVDRYDVVFETAGMPYPTQHECIRYVEPVELKDYASLVARFDIGLAPVVDNVFNRAKSDLKFLEYAACGIPVVASKCETYASVQHGVTGLLAKTPADWLKHISRLIENPELRQTMGAAARAYAETRMIRDNGHAWESAYGLADRCDSESRPSLTRSASAAA